MLDIRIITVQYIQENRSVHLIKHSSTHASKRAVILDFFFFAVKNNQHKLPRN